MPIAPKVVPLAKIPTFQPKREKTSARGYDHVHRALRRLVFAEQGGLCFAHTIGLCAEPCISWAEHNHHTCGDSHCRIREHQIGLCGYHHYVAHHPEKKPIQP